MDAERDREIRVALELLNPEPLYLTGDAILADLPPKPEPLAWSVDEGGAVLHEGRRYLVVGEPGIGKSLLGLAACVEVALGGRPAVYLDWEDSARTYMLRARHLLTTLAERGIPTDPEVVSYLYYRAMQGEALNPERVIIPEGCVLVVIDSLSLAMGGDENAAEDFQRFHAAAEAVRGDAALLVLDHPGHGDPTRGRGTSAKRPAFDVDLTLKRDGGFLRFVLRKDRHADYDLPVGAIVAQPSIARAEDDCVRVGMRASDMPTNADGSKRYTGWMRKVSRHLTSMAEPVTARQLRDALKGGNDAASPREKAIRTLVAEGYVEVGEGSRGVSTYRLVRPYSEGQDARSGIGDTSRWSDSYRTTTSEGDPSCCAVVRSWSGRSRRIVPAQVGSGPVWSGLVRSRVVVVRSGPVS